MYALIASEKKPKIRYKRRIIFIFFDNTTSKKYDNENKTKKKVNTRLTKKKQAS